MNNSEQQTDARQQEGAVAKTIDQQGGNAVKCLYVVQSKMNGVCHYGDLFDEVPVSWICDNRDYPLVPPEEGIEGYDKTKPECSSALKALKELFSEEEAEALKSYFDSFQEITMTRIIKIDLPIPSPYLGCRDLVNYFYKPRDGMGYWLPAGYDWKALRFTVEGCYDVNGAKPHNPRACPICAQKKTKVQDALDDDDMPVPL